MKAPFIAQLCKDINIYPADFVLTKMQQKTVLMTDKQEFREKEKDNRWLVLLI